MADAIADVQLPIILALILAGVVSALLAFLFGIPVLRLKSDYFAIATLGLAEIIRIVVGSSLMNNITNGSLGLKSIPSFPSIFGVIPGFYFPFIVIASKEWLLRCLDTEMYIGAFQVPLLKSGFRMVVFSVILMIVVLFFRRGLMGNREFSWEGFFGLFRCRKKKENSQGGEQIG